jgi:hypothetical protein
MRSSRAAAGVFACCCAGSAIRRPPAAVPAELEAEIADAGRDDEG